MSVMHNLCCYSRYSTFFLVRYYILWTVRVARGARATLSFTVNSLSTTRLEATFSNVLVIVLCDTTARVALIVEVEADNIMEPVQTHMKRR
jgi:hypothetical protein